ncbi:MAG: signal peptidase I [Gammaproteobacteria bacterium]|nr:signal peptidase I [Gammaproteobacteria bacterium]
MKSPKYLTATLSLLGCLAILPAYLRAVTVAGPSDAPTLLLGDQLLINLAAYRVDLPYTGIALWERGGPQRGEMVMFHVPNRGLRGLKRVIGLPGDTVELRENVVLVNGEALGQETLDRGAFAAWVPDKHKIGSEVTREAGRDTITYSPGAADLRTMPAVTVATGQYFLLGDHRDDSNDSRMFGTVDRPKAMLPSW